MRTTTFLLSSVLLLGLLQSCKAPEAYRRAQTAFSQGAAIEIEERFADAAEQLPSNFIYFDDLYRPSAPANPERSANGYYEEALGEVSTALRGKRQLEKIRALDNAYAIKALSLWRLENYGEARSVAETAIPLLERNETDESDVRDLAMMQSLPGLINIDLSYEALQQIKERGTALATSEDEAERAAIYQEIKTLFIDHFTSDTDGDPSVMRGLALIERAIGNMQGESAIKMYLRNAQLAGIDNWGDAFQVVFLSARRLNDSSEELNWVVEGRDLYKDLVRSYLQKLIATLPNGKDDKLYLYWARLLGGDV